MRILCQVLSSRVCYRKKSSSLRIMKKTQDYECQEEEEGMRAFKELFPQRMKFRWERVLEVYTKET